MNSDMLTTLYVIGPILLLLNFIFLGMIFFTRRKVKQVNEWPSTMGTVLISTLRKEYSGDSGDVTYPVVKYSYQVGGKAFQGDRIAPGQGVGGSGAGMVIARYPMGAQVSVYYNPQNPSEAVLEKKAPAQFLFWLMLIIFNLVLGCGVPFMVWSSHN